MKTLALAILIPLFVSACAPDSPTVTVRLRTAFETRGNFKNLLRTMAAPPAYTPTGQSCLQKNLYAAVDASGLDKDSGLTLETTPIVAETGMSSGAFTIDADWIATYGMPSKPISVTVPRGIPVGVGIVGALVASEQRDPGAETCRDFDPVTLAPYQSTSVIGHREIIANGIIDVPIKVWVLPALEAVSPQATPPAGDPNCDSGPDSSQNCPGIDFLRLSCTDCGANSRYVRLEYAANRLDPRKRVIQWLHYNELVTGEVNIPDILPMRVVVTDSSLTELARVDITRNDFTGTPSAASKSFPAGTVGSSITWLTLTERSRRPPPTISAFTISALTGTGAGQAQLTWNLPANGETYQVWYASTSGGVLTSTLGTVSNSNTLALSSSPGFTHWIKIEATNSRGSASVYSDERPWTPIGTWGANPTVNGIATGTATVNWGSLPTGGSGGTFNIFARNTSTGVTSTVSAGVGATSATFTGLATGNYAFSVAVYNTQGGKSVSSEAGPYAIP